MGFAFPSWVEARLLSDEAFAEAYDALSSEERAHIKTAIARMAAVYGTPDVPACKSVKSMRQGFRLHERMSPATWALVVWDGAYAGPTRVLAALLPAMLAGVPNILACRVASEDEGRSISSPVLAALELAGQELVACFTPGETAKLIAECAETGERGCVAVLGSRDYLPTIGREAIGHGVPLRRLIQAVRIGVDLDSLPEMVSAPPYGKLLFAHPDADLVTFRGKVPAGLLAVFCGEEAVPRSVVRSPFVLTPGNEVCWVWPDLGLDFFRARGMALCGPDPVPFE